MLLLMLVLSEYQQLILAAVIRHLDHKNVAHDPQIKSHVIQVATALARQIRSGAVLAELGFVSDLCRHLRKSLQATIEPVGGEDLTLNISLQNSIEDCLLEIAKRVSSMPSFLNNFMLLYGLKCYILCQFLLDW